MTDWSKYILVRDDNGEWHRDVEDCDVKLWRKENVGKLYGGRDRNYQEGTWGNRQNESK